MAVSAAKMRDRRLEKADLYAREISDWIQRAQADPSTTRMANLLQWTSRLNNLIWEAGFYQAQAEGKKWDK